MISYVFCFLSIELCSQYRFVHECYGHLGVAGFDLQAQGDLRPPHSGPQPGHLVKFDSNHLPLLHQGTINCSSLLGRVVLKAQFMKLTYFTTVTIVPYLGDTRTPSYRINFGDPAVFLTVGSHRVRCQVDDQRSFLHPTWRRVQTFGVLWSACGSNEYVSLRSVVCWHASNLLSYRNQANIKKNSLAL